MDDALSRRLAANLSQLRQDRGLTQAALAAHAGVPRSTIANLESGGGNPSLSNLASLAAALRVSIEELLARPRTDCALLRAKEIPVAERAHGAALVSQLLPDPLPGLQIERLELRPGGFMRGVPHLRGAKEYLTCLTGAIRVTVGGRHHDLGPGDVLAFPGDQPHAYRNMARTTSASISVVALGGA